MADSLVKQLLDAGVHYGHKASNWNPKMQPYIFGKKNRIHIIDIRETIKGLLLAKQFITRLVASGKDVLFVGTKRQARPAIESICDEIEMPYVVERWLGGTLTNFRTIRSRLKRLDELDQLMASPEWENYSKKMASQLSRERRKIHRNLAGLRRMEKLPGALVVIDVHREYNALAEARKLGLPTVCLIDTDSDPDLADIPVPGNDDAMRAIEIIMRQLGDAVQEGKTARAQQKLEKKGAEGEGERPRRRSSRAKFRADDSVEAGSAAADTPQDAGDAPKTEGPVKADAEKPVEQAAEDAGTAPKGPPQAETGAGVAADAETEPAEKA